MADYGARGTASGELLGDVGQENDRARITALANTNHVPATYPHREYVQSRGLMSYGASVPDMFRHAATYVVKILKGAKPADLPVE